MRLNKLIKPVLLASLCALSSVAIAQTKVIYNANGYTPLYKGKMRHGEVNTFTTLEKKMAKL